MKSHPLNTSCTEQGKHKGIKGFLTQSSRNSTVSIWNCTSVLLIMRFCKSHRECHSDWKEGAVEKKGWSGFSEMTFEGSWCVCVCLYPLWNFRKLPVEWKSHFSETVYIFNPFTHCYTSTTFSFLYKNPRGEVGSKDRFFLRKCSA